MVLRAASYGCADLNTLPLHCLVPAATVPAPNTAAFVASEPVAEKPRIKHDWYQVCMPWSSQFLDHADYI